MALISFMFSQKLKTQTDLSKRMMVKLSQIKFAFILALENVILQNQSSY